MKAVAQFEHEIRTVAAGEFKAKCLQLMDEVKDRGLTITVTKRGRPVGQFVPMPANEQTFHSLVGRSPGIQILGDVVSPLPEDWTTPELFWEKTATRTKAKKKKR